MKSINNMKSIKVFLSRTIKSLSIQNNYQPLNNAVLFSTNCRRFKEHEFTTRLTEDKTIKDQFHIRDLCNFGEKTPLGLIVVIFIICTIFSHFFTGVQDKFEYKINSINLNKLT